MWNYVFFFSLFKGSKVGSIAIIRGEVVVLSNVIGNYPISEGQDLCGFPHESGKSNE